MSTHPSPSADASLSGARRDRRSVAFAALGAVVLSAGGYLLLTPGGNTTGAADAALPVAPAAAAASATPAAGAAAPVAEVELQPGRDPFQVLSPVTAVPPPPAPSPAAPAERTLVLQGVEVAGQQPTAVFTLDGAGLRAQVGGSFGPDAALLLLSLQQETDGPGWTAVVQRGTGEPFDLTTGTHVHLS